MKTFYISTTFTFCLHEWNKHYSHRQKNIEKKMGWVEEIFLFSGEGAWNFFEVWLSIFYALPLSLLQLIVVTSLGIVLYNIAHLSFKKNFLLLQAK